MTVNEIFKAIATISTEDRPAAISILAMELELSKYDLLPHFVTLRKLDLVFFDSSYIALTDKGLEILMPATFSPEYAD